MEATNDDLDWAKRVLQQITHDPDLLAVLAALQRHQEDERRVWQQRQGKPPTPPPTAS